MRKAIFTFALTATCMLSCAQETINLPAQRWGSIPWHVLRWMSTYYAKSWV